jgi:hypothetical protein
MIRKPAKIVNTRLAATCTIFPIGGLEERKPEQLKSEVLKAKPIKKRLPGDALLKKLSKERERRKEKEAEQRREKSLMGLVDPVEAEKAVTAILADLA